MSCGTHVTSDLRRGVGGFDVDEVDSRSREAPDRSFGRFALLEDADHGELVQNVPYGPIGTRDIYTERLLRPLGDPGLCACNGVEVLRGCGTEERRCGNPPRKLRREPVAATP